MQSLPSSSHPDAPTPDISAPHGAAPSVTRVRRGDLAPSEPAKAPPRQSMEIYYDTMTGNTRRIATRLQALLSQAGIDAPLGDVRRGDVPQGPYLLITHTFDRGGVPQSTRDFLARHAPLLAGVASSGTHNWGVHFAQAAETISRQYGVPAVAKINKSGNEADIRALAGWVLSRHQQQAV